MPTNSRTPTGAERACCMDCGDLASGHHGIPFDPRMVEPVANDAEGEWVAYASCERCHDVHAAGGPKGLDAYLKATASLREALAKARNALLIVQTKAEKTLEEIGDSPWP